MDLSGAPQEKIKTGYYFFGVLTFVGMLGTLWGLYLWATTGAYDLATMGLSGTASGLWITANCRRALRAKESTAS